MPAGSGKSGRRSARVIAGNREANHSGLRCTGDPDAVPGGSGSRDESKAEYVLTTQGEPFGFIAATGRARGRGRLAIAFVGEGRAAATAGGYDEGASGCMREVRLLSLGMPDERGGGSACGG